MSNPFHQALDHNLDRSQHIQGIVQIKGQSGLNQYRTIADIPLVDAINTQDQREQVPAE